MGKDVIHDNEYMTVWYHTDKKIVHHEFHQFTYGEDLKQGLTAGAEVLEKNKVKKYLSDDRQNPALRKEDMDWTSTVWRKRAIGAGWKYWAIVLPEKMAGQMAMKRIIEDYASTGVTVQLFDDPAEALKWLESQS